MNTRHAELLCGVLLGSIAAVTQAAIPGAGGVITACIDAKGAMRAIDAEAGAQCTNKERPVTFNAASQAGAPGATRPADRAMPMSRSWADLALFP